MRMKAEDGKLYAVVTLRDVVERNDVGDLPFLSEIKRLYDENAKLRELVGEYARYVRHGCCGCPEKDMCGLGIGYKGCNIRIRLDYETRELGIEVKLDE